MNIMKLSFIVFLSILYSIVSFAEKKTNTCIEIGTFDSIPAEIDGGYCFFYKYPKTEGGKDFVMVNDLAATAYMVVNHNLEKFSLVSNRKDFFLYRNSKFILKVKISNTWSERNSESYKMKGILMIEDSHKNKRKLTFYGNCCW